MTWSGSSASNAVSKSGQLYFQFGAAIRGQQSSYPDFDTAVELHRLVDHIRQASDEGRAVATAS